MARIMSSLPDAGRIGSGNKSDLMKLNSSSKFVPNGRGHVNLNCFRIHEAMLNGAIPVVLETNREGKIAYYTGPLPSGRPRAVAISSLPWIVVSTWKQAKEH